MRTFDNPIKNSLQLSIIHKLHRIIIPVYIPNEEGFYKDCFRIFQISLESLFNTIDLGKVNITIINNSSIQKVHDYVMENLAKGVVDQYINNSVNRGKPDMIVGIAKSCYEPFVTIADADVLFLNGWLEYVEKIYSIFPHAGAVCPFPAPHLKFNFTSSTWIRNIFRIRLKSVLSVSELRTFEKNLGLKDFFHPFDLNQQFYIKKKDCVALVGNGHFVATYRSKVFRTIQYSPTLQGLKGGLKSIEEHVDRLGLSHLSIAENYVLHMGNVFEAWMVSSVRNEESSIKSPNVPLVAEYNALLSVIPYSIRSLVGKSASMTFSVLKKVGFLK